MRENLSCLLIIFTAIFFGEFVVALISDNTAFALWKLICLLPVIILLGSARRELNAKNILVLSDFGLKQLRRIKRWHKLQDLIEAFEMALTTQLGFDEVRSRGGVIIIRDEKKFKEIRIKSSEITPEKISEFFGKEDFMEGDDGPGKENLET